MAKKQKETKAPQKLTQGVDLRSWLAAQPKAFQTKVTKEGQKKTASKSKAK